MPRAQTCHPLDPLSAAEISVAVATVRAAGETPEVLNHFMFLLYIDQLCTLLIVSSKLQIAKILVDLQDHFATYNYLSCTC